MDVPDDLRSPRRPVALVTGGARGIGAATTVALAEAGHDVAIADISVGSEAAAVMAAAAGVGARALAFEVDVGSVDACQGLVDAIVDALGGVDVLVNNAGGGLGDYTPFEGVTEEAYDRIVGINLRAVFFLTQRCAPYLRSRRGAVINLASDLVYTGYELMPAYTAAKGGVVALTRSLALAFAPDVRVNAVAPGPTATPHFKAERWYSSERLTEIPLRRFGEPQDIAHAIVFLASAEAAWITGQTLGVNGGFVMP